MASGTSWNLDWAKDYGPDVDKAKKAPKKEVQAAIKALTTKVTDGYFEEAQENAAKHPLAADLMQHQEELIQVMTAYYAWQRRMQDENDMAALLLLI
jgi:hypothetical protein